MRVAGALEARSPGDDSQWAAASNSGKAQFSPRRCSKMQLVNAEENSRCKSITMAQANAVLVSLPSIRWCGYRSTKSAYRKEGFLESY